MEYYARRVGEACDVFCASVLRTITAGLISERNRGSTVAHLEAIVARIRQTSAAHNRPHDCQGTR